MIEEKTKKFRGRIVFSDYGYPAVMWPSHPLSRTNGAVRIHRIVAYEKYNEIPDGYHVHHKDGNRWNWAQNNLELVTASDHARIHKTGPHHEVYGKISCANCGVKIKVSKYRVDERKYCSLSCANYDRHGISWPPDDVLEELVWKKPLVELAEEIGCSDRGLAKHCKRRGIETPGRGYWQKKRADYVD
jgi:hypothetical protein